MLRCKAIIFYKTTSSNPISAGLATLFLFMSQELQSSRKSATRDVAIVAGDLNLKGFLIYSVDSPVKYAINKYNTYSYH